VAGRFFVEQEGVAVPAGWRWEPAVDAAVLRRLCNLGPGDLALLDQDGTFDLVPAGQFVRASRSAVRLSARGEGHG
jgi:MoxR-vWA-beta-propeller ternary system domain bpX2